MSSSQPSSALDSIKKLLLIGSSGSGKSTLARSIATRAGLPLIHLDALYWSPGWKEPAPEQWQATVAALVMQPAWVMDGNYGRTLPMRLAACDAVVFLDVPRWRCLWRIVWRRIRFHGRSRPDMGPGCVERLSWTLIRFVWAYRRNRRPEILQQLRQAQQQGKHIFVLSNAGEVERFLHDLPAAADRSSAFTAPQKTPDG